MSEQIAVDQAPAPVLSDGQWKEAFQELFREHVQLKGEYEEVVDDYHIVLEDHRRTYKEMHELRTANDRNHADLARLSQSIAEVTSEYEIFGLIRGELFEGISEVVDAADAQVQGEYVAVPRRIADRLRRTQRDIETLRKNSSTHEGDNT